MDDLATATTKRKRKSLGRCCAVPSCASKSNVNKNISWSQFPSNPVLKEEWLKRIKRSDSKDSFILWKPSKHAKVCGYHFDKSGKRKATQRIPTLHLGRTYNLEDDLNAGVKLGEDVVCEPNPSSQELRNQPSPSSQEPRNQPSTSKQEPGPSNPDSNTRPISELDYCFSDDEMQIDQDQQNSHSSLVNTQFSEESDKSLEESNLRDVVYIAELKNKIFELEKQSSNLKSSELSSDQFLNFVERNKDLEHDRLELENDNREQQKIIIDMQQKLLDAEKHKFSYKTILQNEEKIQFYTGFKKKQRYEIFLKLVLDAYNNSKYKKTTGRKCILPPEEQIFMYLCRLRLGLLEQDLAFRFGVCLSTVSNLCSFWCPFICDILEQVPIWLDRKTIEETSSAEIRGAFPNLRIIIDGTEIFVETPSDFQVQGATWSDYKHHTTAKGIVGIAPCGFITFVSDLAAGRTSDKKLTNLSGLYKLLEPGDLVLADRGFLIEDELKKLGVQLNIPPFLRGRPRLPENEELQCRKIAKHRIHVERVISCIKNFRILKTTFPNSMHDKLNDVWKTCVLLCNFIDEPLLLRKTE
ncbi:hypothetical protein B566_EDAN013740 [Ephemera danica]|nr:hypothetical protein B566_EDAN013740 [Ephemera danica]